MSAFDALGPKTRAVLASAPQALEAHKLGSLTGLSARQMREQDNAFANSLGKMIADEYGDLHPLERCKR